MPVAPHRASSGRPRGSCGEPRGLALLVAAIVGVLLTRYIMVPLAKAVELAETVAAGDLTGQIDSHAQDEVGQLLRALGRMNGNLRNIIGEVRSGTNVVTEASGNIASGNRELGRARSGKPRRCRKPRPSWSG